MIKENDSCAMSIVRMNMKNKQSRNINEKPSYLHDCSEKWGKIPYKGELLGAILIIMIFLSLMAPSLWKIVSVPAPGIKIISPENITFNTSTPPLNFIVGGSNLDRVLLSVDDGPDITVPHEGSIANIDFARLNPIFIDDFSATTEGIWKAGNSWKLEGGRYITTGGTSVFGDPGWSDYIIETKIKINSGKDVSIDFRWDGGDNNYRLQTTDLYRNFMLHKISNGSYVTLSHKKLTGIDPDGWHTWKIIANSSNIRAFIDNVPYIDYTDSDRPYLKGKFRLRATLANVEYDYVYVYKPLSRGQHNLKILASNTAHNSISKVVNFTISK